MTFTEWKERKCLGWYLNDWQQDEELFEKHLKDQRKEHETMSKKGKKLPLHTVLRQDYHVQR